MAQSVKFYKLGSIGKPIAYSTYQACCKSGAIVFAIVLDLNGSWDSDSSVLVPPQRYIWANGIEYKVPDQAALEYVVTQVNKLNGDAATEGSVANLIAKALDKYKPKAEDIAELISDESNVHVEVVDSSLKLTVDARKAVITVGSEDPTDHEFTETPGHGDYYVKEEVITEKLGAEPRRTAYIYNEEAGAWQVLDGNVDATNVFFKDGVNRTAAIGVLKASLDIQNEGKAMNLKELLEYYLVEEIYPTVKVTTATAATSAYDILLAKPAASIATTTYMDKTAALAEVGTSYKFKGLSLTETATHNGPATINSTASSITGMKYGAATKVGGTVDTTKTSDTAAATTATATYTTNFDEATATAKFDCVKGFTGMADEEQSVTGLNGKSLELAEQTGVVVEGKEANQVKLSWSNTATVSREITGDSVAALGDYYYASNKGNTDAEHKASTAEVAWSDGHANATGVSYSTTDLTVTGVYPIYTNGGRISDKASNTAATGEAGEFTTNTIDDVTCIKYDTLINYTSATTTKAYDTAKLYIRFGNVENSDRIIYVAKPSGYTVSIKEAIGFNGAALQFNEDLTSKWAADATEVTINGIVYTSLRQKFAAGPSGKKELQIILSYKKKA